jgi:pyrimidine deaminase RibD-like protein
VTAAYPAETREPARTRMAGREAWMWRAIELARQGQGRTHPNPAVGAVIVRDGVLLGEGFHERAGWPHAEPNAVRHARASGHCVADATLYVTLEPCSSWGRTPPVHRSDHPGADRLCRRRRYRPRSSPRRACL